MTPGLSGVAAVAVMERRADKKSFLGPGIEQTRAENRDAIAPMIG